MAKKINWHLRKARNWKHLPAPARPWPSEVRMFEKYVIEKKKQGKMDVLVLGSTVEFRSMLHKHKMRVHVVDFSRDFYNILSKQPMEFRGKEKFYKQNWVDMKLGKQFDLIFSDWVPGVLHTKNYDSFFKSVARHLKPDGLWIARQPVLLNKNKINLERVVREHNKKYAKSYSFYQTSAHHVYHYRPNPKTNVCDNLDVIREALDDVWEKGLLADKDYYFFMYALSFESGTISVLVKRDLEKWLRKYFVILNEHHGQNPGASWFPIYALRKK